LINAAKRNSQRPEERFSDRSKVDYAAAQQKARNLGFEYIGTETMLLVLIEDRNSGVSELIENLGVDLKTRGKHLLALIGIGSQAVPEGKLPKTPRLWRSIKWAAEEADNLGHDIIEPEHILLGMLREGTGSSAMALVKLGVTIENAREAVWNKYASPPDSGPIPGQ
jgi:ATP-dependent Clp protease ATP-binding subunit ClpC